MGETQAVKYPASYCIKREDPPITRDELKKRRAQDGLPWIPTAAMMFASIVEENEQGVASVFFGSHNGATGMPLNDHQLFDILGLLGEVLATSDGLHPKQRAFAELIGKTWRRSKE